MRVEVALALVVGGLAACGAPRGELLEWEHPGGLAVDYFLAASTDGPYYPLRPTIRRAGTPPTLGAPLPEALHTAPALYLKACVRRPGGIVIQPEAAVCSPPASITRP